MSDRLRVVLDTNVLVSALLRPDSTPSRAVFEALRHCEVLTSAEALHELRAVLERDKFDPYVDRETRRRFLARFTIDATLIDPVAPVKVCRDTADDALLALALAGKATYLISGDADLRSHSGWNGIAVLDPAQFLRVLAFD